MKSNLRKIGELPKQAWCIDALKSALEKAERGEVLAVALCYVDSEGLTHTDYASQSHRSGLRDLSAAVALLSHKVLARWAEIG